MPWKTSSAMEERARFVFEYERDERTMTELCEDFWISRECGYRWLRRYRQHGLAGLVELTGMLSGIPTRRRLRLKRPCLVCARRTCAGDRGS